jgi:hypothetical protein
MPIAEAAAGPVERMSISNIVNARTIEAQFNPTEIQEEISVNWNELTVLGQSHRPHQYQSTDNHQFTFTMRFDGTNLGPLSPAIVGASRNFLLAACYSPRGPTNILGAAPPRLLFVWPGLASITTVIHKLKFRHLKMNRRGGPIRFDAEVLLKEIRDVRLHMEDLPIEGTFRSGAPVPEVVL